MRTAAKMRPPVMALGTSWPPVNTTHMSAFPCLSLNLACLDLLELPKYCKDTCCLPLNACDALMPEGCLQEVEDILDAVWNVVKDESGAGGYGKRSNPQQRNFKLKKVLTRKFERLAKSKGSVIKKVSADPVLHTI